MTDYQGRTASAPPIEVRNETTIAAPAGPVWDLLTDVGVWPSWYRACRWVRVERAGDDGRAVWFRWKAHPIELRSTVLVRERPHRFVIVAEGLGVRATRTFTLRPALDGRGTLVISHETQDGWLPWLGRLVLARRLHAANQAMFADLARAIGSRGPTRVPSMTR